MESGDGSDGIKGPREVPENRPGKLQQIDALADVYVRQFTELAGTDAVKSQLSHVSHYNPREIAKLLFESHSLGIEAPYLFALASKWQELRERQGDSIDM